MDAEITLITGQTVTGKISYISPSADPATRTFLTEIEIPNEDGSLRDGITASAIIGLKGTEAYRVVSSWLTLDDSGQIGVRVVEDDDRVDFVSLKIVAHTPETMWVTGLAPGTRVITLGQDYVTPGQAVEPVPSELATNRASEGARS
jgi:multidrug efflux system membrane fusion protein